MSKYTSVDVMSAEITLALSQYSEESMAELAKKIHSIGRNGAKLLNQQSPKRTGRYAKGWTYKKQNTSKQKVSGVIHNKDRYELAHLLEHGTSMGAKAHVHIAPVDESVSEAIEKAVKEAFG